VTATPTLVLATQAPGEPEIFASLQGEGPSAGMPVAFLRLSRCNLACTWCDTRYTWDFDQFDRAQNQLTLDITDVAQRVLAMNQNRLVITGGEPLLQAARLAQLLELLPDMRVEIETNGTVRPPARLDVRVDQYNVSPKLAHSGNAAELALIPAMLDHWAADPRAFVKFVIAAPEQVDQVLALAKTHAIAATRIYLMPEGTDSATLRSREKWLAPLCVAHGLRLSDRLHIHLYGDTRGT
jgi:organic radical activating enzyme